MIDRAQGAKYALLMTSAEQASQALTKASAGLDTELKRILEERAHGPAARMYHMLLYFMGYLESDLMSAKGVTDGKRLRPALSLLIADAYGVRAKSMNAALAIELFHNFTLVHDDIADRDEYRRNRATVWKLWGINHALNAGDAQALLAAELCLKASRESGVSPELADELMNAFLETCEGQYLDFELSDAKKVTEEAYLTMTMKKTGALMRISAEAPGIIAGSPPEERTHLRVFGESLGMAFQIADDFRSVWATKAETGKDVQSDIRERKRTLPFLAALAGLHGSAKTRLIKLYALPRQLTEVEIQEGLSTINRTSARSYVSAAVQKHADNARNAAAALSLPANVRETLSQIVDELVADAR